MITQSLRNEVYYAVEEFNKIMLKPEHKNDSDEERKGIFYTTLRRNFRFGSKRRELSPRSMLCKFNENGTLKAFRINGGFDYGWSLDMEPLRQLKELSYEKPEFFPTPAMNYIADIVNSIK